MAMNMIIFLPIACAFGLLYWADQLDEEHEILRLIFQFAFVPLFFLGTHLAIIDATIVYASDAQLVETLADFAYYLGWFMFIIGVYWIFIIFKRVYNLIMQRKAEKHEAKDG